MYNACTFQFFSLRVQVQIILMLINLPLYWDMVVSIYGFFILPWYTVLICEAADQIAGGLFHAFFLVSVIRRFGVFVALLVSYIIRLSPHFGTLDFSEKYIPTCSTSDPTWESEFACAL